jgi:hypothetical protein
MTDLTPIERLISGRGEIQIPEEYNNARYGLLFCQVVRFPRNRSLNVTYNPDKSFYAHICFMYDDFVVQTYDVSFEYQCFEVIANMDAQIMLAIKCLAASIDPQSPVLEFKYTKFLSNKIRFECFAETALLLTLKGTELQSCDPMDKDPDDPPPPPPKQDKVESGTGIEVSPPYPDDPDNTNTDPNPLDDIENPPGSEACVQYTVTYSYDTQSGEQPPTRVTGQVIHAWGVIGAIIAGRDPALDPQIRLVCQGIVDFDQPCEESREIGISTLTNAGLEVTFSNPTIDSVT